MRKINNVRITIKDITEALQTIHEGYLNAPFGSKKYHTLTYTGDLDTEDRGIEVRLQVVDGSYHVLSGDPQYDTDHRGFWGCAFIPVGYGMNNHYKCNLERKLKKVARELIDDACENYWELK